MSAIHLYKPGDHYLQILEDLDSSGIAKGYDLCELSFALAKAYEDTAEIEKRSVTCVEATRAVSRCLAEIEQDQRLFSLLRSAQPSLADATLTSELATVNWSHIYRGYAPVGHHPS